MMKMRAVWRGQDDALLRRLEDEILIERLWQAEAGDAPGLPERASGLIEALRPAGVADPFASLAAADAGEAVDLGELQQRLWPSRLVGLPAPLLHHLAVFHHHLAEHRLATQRSRPSRRARRSARAGATVVVRAARFSRLLAGRRLSLACWLALLAERRYLADLCRAMLPSADDAQIEQHVLQAALAPIEALGACARDGAGSCSLEGALALQSLAELPDAARIAGGATRRVRPALARAARLRAAAVDAALQPVSERLDDMMARGAACEEGGVAAEHLLDVWRWSGEDEAVERYVVTQLKPVAWSIYKQEPGFDGLRALLAPLERTIDQLAGRVAGDPARLAYAAPCAQMFVFRAEMATTQEQRRDRLAYALKLCPTHRNARSLMAGMLLNEVRGRLASHAPMRGIWPWASRDFDEMAAQLDRAEELFPGVDGLDEVRRQLQQARDGSLFGG